MLYLIPSLLSGYFTKVCDDYSEKKSKKLLYSLIFSLLYGLSIILCAFLQPALLPLIAGVVAGNIFAGKVDAREHVFASIIIIVFYMVYFQASTVWIFFLFTFISFLDEVGHEYGTKHKNKYLISRFLSPTIAFIISLYLWDFSFILFMILFDLGYISAERKIFIK